MGRNGSAAGAQARARGQRLRSPGHPRTGALRAPSWHTSSRTRSGSGAKRSSPPGLTRGGQVAGDLRAASRASSAAQLGVRPGMIRYTSRVLCSGLQLNSVWYKGFAITVRTFQIRGSGRWTLDLLIGRNTDLRAFSGPSTYPTEESAITGCCEFGQRIIDGRVRDSSVADLS